MGRKMEAKERRSMISYWSKSIGACSEKLAKLQIKPNNAFNMTIWTRLRANIVDVPWNRSFDKN